jgi:hypothetical protein
MNARAMRLLSAVLLCASAGAQAQVCGDTIYTNTILTADITCGPSDPVGLHIGAPGVTLDLGGHTIWMNAPGSWGVLVHRHGGATVANGKIWASSGAHSTAWGVGLFFAADTVISGIKVEGASIGVWVAESPRVSIVHSDFRTDTGVWAGPAHFASIGPSNDLYIAHNRMYGASQGAVFAELNRRGDGVVIESNSASNIAKGIRETGVYTNVLVVGNTFAGGKEPISGSIGVELRGRGNDWQLHKNRFLGFETGVLIGIDGVTLSSNQIGDWLPVAGGRGVAFDCGTGTPRSASVIQDNVIDNVETGIEFGSCTQNNDGRYNRYGNVWNPVADYGTGNLW